MDVESERDNVARRAMRDELVSVLRTSANAAAAAGLPAPSHESYADAVLEAGWRPPPSMITDPGRLDALAEGAAIVDALGVPRQLVQGQWVAPSAESLSTQQVPLPAEVTIDPGRR